MPLIAWIVAAMIANGAPPDASDDPGDIPAGAPSDDYGFVAWCYGALGESLTIYDRIQPELKAIDALFGTSVQEAHPYHADVAAERLALKRFAGALGAAERSSAEPLAERGATDIRAGRAIWALAEREPDRKLADAWLFWGVPKRCETAAQALEAAAPRRGVRTDAPSAVAIAARDSTPAADLAPAPDQTAPAPVGSPPRRGSAPPE